MTHYPDGQCDTCGHTLHVRPCTNCRDREALLAGTEVMSE